MLNDFVLIGSRAIEMRQPQLLKRKPSNFDFVCTKEACLSFIKDNFSKLGIKKIYAPQTNKIVCKGDVNHNFEIVRSGTSAEPLFDLVKNDKDSLRTDFGYVPNLNILFALKKSHRFSKNYREFYKTFVDYHSLKQVGCNDKRYRDLLEARQKEAIYSKPAGRSFFNDTSSFASKLNHEKLRKLMSHPLLDGLGSPICADFEQSKYQSLSPSMKLRAIIEEIAVASCKRQLAIYPGKTTEKEAWLIAFHKFVVQLCPEWAREEVYENGPKVIMSIPAGYSDMFQNNVKQLLQ